jgi:hypothetical protein
MANELSDKTLYDFGMVKIIELDGQECWEFCDCDEEVENG